MDPPWRLVSGPGDPAGPPRGTHWGGDEPHAILRPGGGIRRLKADLLHYSNESIDRQVFKIGPYSDAFAKAALASGRTAGWTDFAVRPWWRFIRGYFLRLGFLDGLPGYYIAWSNAFLVMTRYAKLREADVRKESKAE